MQHRTDTTPTPDRRILSQRHRDLVAFSQLAHARLLALDVFGLEGLVAIQAEAADLSLEDVDELAAELLR